MTGHSLEVFCTVYISGLRAWERSSAMYGRHSNDTMTHDVTMLGGNALHIGTSARIFVEHGISRRLKKRIVRRTPRHMCSDRLQKGRAVIL